MSAFGNVGHVLTNTARNANQTTENYFCISAPTNGPYLYELDNSTGNQNIEYNVSTNAWNANPSTNGNHDPSNFLNAGSNGSNIITPSNANSTLHIGYGTTSTIWMASFSVVYTSGPNVTSITATKVIVPSDTVSNTDFTLLKNGSAYANTNISVTLGNFDPVDENRFYDYGLITTTNHDTGHYKFTIDSKSITNYHYDDSWTSNVSGAASSRQTTSSRILNVLGTIPSATIINGIPSTGYTIDRRQRSIVYVPTTFYVNGVAAIRTIYYGLFISGTTTNIKATLSIYNHVTLDWVTADFNVGNQQTMTLTSGIYSINVTDWVYSDQPEGDGYMAPVSTSSDGGRKQRYPIISTNLFDRQKSIFSIGITHKDETLF